MGGICVVLKELCLLRGVSGDEGRVRDFIKSHIEAHADRTWTDPIGNLMAYKKARRAKSTSCSPPIWTKWASWCWASTTTAF